MKQDALWSLLLKFALEFVIRDDQVSQEGLELNSELQLLEYADDVNILVENKHTVRKNKEALVVTTMEVGPEYASRTLTAERSPSRNWTILVPVILFYFS